MEHLSSQTLVTQAANIIKDLILTGKIKAGERLKETELEKALGISRTPLREAMALLQAEGLIVTHPRRGRFVKKIDIKEISDICEVRIALEALAVRLAHKHITPKDVLKLQMILNEVRLKTRCHRLPSISSQYNADLQEGDRLIRRVRSVLEHTPLDVSELNADLQEAIDFIYKLYNNASNLVGIAIMVENAIVFGNRYRSSYPSIDSELTRAELSFQNGEYTKALKIAIQSIEKMHPGIYEKLIKTNDPGIMNQAA